MTAAVEFRRWWVVAAAGTGIGGVAIAWALAHPAGPSPSALLRVLADCLGALVLGFGAVGIGMFDGGSTRTVVDRRALWRPVAVAGGAWMLTEIGVLALEASASFGGDVGELSVAAFSSFLSDISVGQLGILALVATACICVYSVCAYRSLASWSAIPVVVFACVTLIVRPITGHMSQQAFGSLLIAAHVLAAALWVGGLAALALTVRTRGGWAVVLPRFSAIALWCVVTVAVTGVVTAVVKVGGIAGFIDTGYGRIVVAKVLILAVLVFLAYRIRLSWLISAASHRSTAEQSLTRAALHVCIIALAFGLASGLATTA